jgi:acyl-CoA synthetase (AMP-forming)/AMP-acid ligase II
VPGALRPHDHISAGYNISGPEVEGILFEHPKVRECAVTGARDAEGAMLVKGLSNALSYGSRNAGQKDRSAA